MADYSIDATTAYTVQHPNGLLIEKKTYCRIFFWLIHYYSFQTCTCIFLYISFIFWTVSLIEGRGDAHVTPLVSMIDLTHLSPFILNHRSNETGPFRGTGLFYLYIGIKMTIVFLSSSWWFVTPFLVVVARGELSQANSSRESHQLWTMCMDFFFHQLFWVTFYWFSVTRTKLVYLLDKKPDIWTVVVALLHGLFMVICSVEHFYHFRPMWMNWSEL